MGNIRPDFVASPGFQVSSYLDNASERLTFTLRPEHVRLLRRMYVMWQPCETGAPEIDPKRPYGNSYVAGDVAEILGLKLPPEGSPREGAFEAKMLALHRETECALQIVLQTGSFRPGEFKRSARFSKWVRVQ